MRSGEGSERGMWALPWSRDKGFTEIVKFQEIKKWGKKEREIKMVWARHLIRPWRERCSRCVHSKFMYLFLQSCWMSWKIQKWTRIMIWRYTSGNKVSTIPVYTLLNHPSNLYPFIEQILFEFLLCEACTEYYRRYEMNKIKTCSQGAY